MNTKSAVLFVPVLIAFVCSSFLPGCGFKKNDNDKNEPSPPTKNEKNKYELSPPTKDGGIYRINKQSGEVLYIIGPASTVVQGTEIVQAITNNVLDWPDIQITQLGDLKVRLRTKWQDGKLSYHFLVWPYEHINSIIKTAPSSAQFLARLDDGDGFNILVIPISLGSFSETIDPNTPDGRKRINAGEINGDETEASIICDLKTYQRLKMWSVSWSGF